VSTAGEINLRHAQYVQRTLMKMILISNSRNL
jgi:hypothetical protein